MAAAKTKSGSKTASKPKSTRSSASKKKASAKDAPVVPVGDHGFAPGTEVGIYKPEEAAYVAADEREPFGDPEAKAKVKDDGTLEVSGLKKGAYIAVGQIAERGGRFGARFRQVNVFVK